MFPLQFPSAVTRSRDLVAAAAQKLFPVLTRRGQASSSAFVGWGVTIVVGAILMLGAAHNNRSHPPLAAVAAVAAAPAQAVAGLPPPQDPSPAKDAIASLAAPSDTTSVAPQEKTTMRVDSTPTGAIASEPNKPKHRVHKKKKDVDSHP